MPSCRPIFAGKGRRFYSVNYSSFLSPRVITGQPLKMEQIVVKSENNTNEEILLYYVDENGENEQGVVTTLENLQQNNYMQDEEEQHIYMTVGDGNELISVQSEDAQQSIQELWTDEETRRLLVFYTDNKQTFLSGETQTRFLWSVACKTMIPTKNPYLCQEKLQNLKQLYLENLLSLKNGDYISWEYFELAHQAFLDDQSVHQELEKNTETFYIEEVSQCQDEIIESSNAQVEEHNIPYEQKHDVMVVSDSTALNDTPILNNLQIIDDFTNRKTIVNSARDPGTLVKVNKKNKTPKHTPNNVEQNDNIQTVLEPPIRPQKKTPDDKIEKMLRIYLKHKNALKNVYRDVWVKGLWENIVLEMGEKDATSWHKRFLNYRMTYVRLLERKKDKSEDMSWPYMALFDEIFKDDADFQRKYNKHKPITKQHEVDTVKWNNTEIMLLVKYYFDSIDEFIDATIPNNFLWNEVGRLLNKNPELCECKYNLLKTEHINTILNEQYNFSSRLPLAILFDNIIAKETKGVIVKSRLLNVHWSGDKVSALVKFVIGYMDMFNDPIGYFVCFAIAAKKLSKSLPSCLSKWQELRDCYTKILNEKNSNSNVQNWFYMNEFDMIYDFGAKEVLLAGYENDIESIQAETPSRAEKDEIETKTNNLVRQVSDQTGDWKAHEILEYYLKNKAKFLSSLYKKLDIWEGLGSRIGLKASQCAHRFRNLKQVYLSHIQREITKPEMPIVWPYYPLCKKVFGYRSLKSKLKSQKHNQQEEWTETEIGSLIQYFKDNLIDEIHSDMNDISVWAGLADIIDRSPHSCREKFIELRKSYRKLKTMKSRKPAVNVTWKYFNLFDDIFTGKEPMDVEHYTRDSEEEEGYECIVILPENNDMSKAKIVTKSPLDQLNSTKPNKWTKQQKKMLLLEYLKYIKSHKNQEINVLKMWNTIADKVDRPTMECRKMYARLNKNMRNNEILNKKYAYAKLINKIREQNPKFKKRLHKIEGFDIRNEYTDIEVQNDKVKSALEYYLSHIEEFTNPRFEKKYVWMELSKAIDVPVKNIFNKVNYLKTTFDNTNENIYKFSEILKTIIQKENELNKYAEMDIDENIEFNGTEWNDSDVESLMIWYLANLERFKSPKYTRKYLWQDISKILHKSPLECSNKMIEIRSEYKKRLINSDELIKWKYSDLCQKIYGTGKICEQN